MLAENLAIKNSNKREKDMFLCFQLLKIILGRTSFRSLMLSPEEKAEGLAQIVLLGIIVFTNSIFIKCVCYAERNTESCSTTWHGVIGQN